MTALEDLLRETLAERKDEAPDDATLLSVVRGRAVRRHRQRQWAVGSVAAVALVAAGLVGGEIFAAHGGSPATGSLGGPARPGGSTGSVALVTTGPCAGLSVTAVQPGGHPDQLRVARFPASNVVSMPAGGPMWLQAHGPCVAQLRFSISGYGLAVAQPGAAAATFNANGGAVVTSDAELGGHGTVVLYLDCPVSTGCPTREPPLAAITVDVKAPTGPTS